MTDSLVIEITRSAKDEWRVVERTHRTTESTYRVNYSAEDLAGLMKEIAVDLGSIDSVDDGDNLRLNRLGARLAEMCLPVPLREKLAVHSGLVEFFLDNESVILPVELLPNQGGVLAANTLVTRHWFCESTLLPRPTPGRKKRQALIVADPARDLPAARKEGTAVQRFFGRRKEWQCRYLARAVTVAELSRELPETDLLHLAAHYEAGESGKQSGIVMTDGRWLPSGASPAPDLVFANCCRSGLPAGVGGDLSLAGRFLKYGARHVIAPFLQVPDEIALKFATAFYTALDRNADVADAVLSARKALGPAGWMYWHFGPTAKEDAQESPSPVRKRTGCSKMLLVFVLGLVIAAAAPWMTPVDRTPAPMPEEPAAVESIALSQIRSGETPIVASSETGPSTRFPVKLNIDQATPASLAPAPEESMVVDSPVTETVTPEAQVVLNENPVCMTPDSAPKTAGISALNSPSSEEASPDDGNTPGQEPRAEVDSSPVILSHVSETETTASEHAPLTEPLDTLATVSSEPAPTGDDVPDGPEAVKPVGIVPQTPHTAVRELIDSNKPGLFDEALAEIARQQSFEDAAIQVLEGFPERYLNAAIKGKPNYNAATGKASVTVEVTIDNEMYRSMASRLSETLKKFGHAGEQVSATMARPYDSFLEVRYQVAGRKRFRELLLLCLRANAALTSSSWEFYSLPSSSIDAILSSMTMPLVSVEFVDHSGEIIAAVSRKIPKPFAATSDRSFMVVPVFESGSADMTMTSLIPGRNRLEVTIEFDLSPDELKRIANAVCTVKKGPKLSDEFTYRFLQ